MVMVKSANKHIALLQKAFPDKGTEWIWHEDPAHKDGSGPISIITENPEITNFLKGIKADIRYGKLEGATIHVIFKLDKDLLKSQAKSSELSTGEGSEAGNGAASAAAQPEVESTAEIASNGEQVDTGDAGAGAAASAVTARGRSSSRSRLAKALGGLKRGSNGHCR